MQQFTRCLALLGLAIALAGCQSFNVQTDWDAEADLAGLNRFYWMEPPEMEGADPFADNSLLRKRVRSAVEEVLVERGYRSVSTPEEADFSVTYSVILDERLRVDGFTSSVDGGVYRRRGDFGSGLATTSVRAYQESTLILDLVAPATGQLLWRGWASGLVRTRDRDHGQDRMRDGVRAILDEFPPEA